MTKHALLILVTLLGADNPNKWEKVEDSDRIQVWARDVPGSPIREIKAVCVIGMPAKRIWDTLADIDHYTEFMPYVEKAFIVSRFDGGHYEYQLIDPPLVDERDYTVKVTLEVDEAAGRFKRSWAPANDKGPKKPEDVVRVEINQGYWQIIAKGPDSAEVTYYLYTDPGGSIPNWIANKANKTSVPDLMRAVRSRSVNPKWTR